MIKEKDLEVARSIMRLVQSGTITAHGLTFNQLKMPTRAQDLQNKLEEQLNQDSEPVTVRQIGTVLWIDTALSNWQSELEKMLADKYGLELSEIQKPMPEQGTSTKACEERGDEIFNNWLDQNREGFNWALKAVFGDEDEVTTYLGNGISDRRIVQMMVGMRIHKRVEFVDRLVSENPDRNEWPAPVTKILELNKPYDDRWAAGERALQESGENIKESMSAAHMFASASARESRRGAEITASDVQSIDELITTLDVTINNLADSQYGAMSDQQVARAKSILEGGAIDALIGKGNDKPMPSEAIEAHTEAQLININTLGQTLDELALSFSTMVDVDNINRVYSILTGESVSQLQVIARTAATLRPANEVTQDELKQILDKHTLTDKPDIELSTNKLPSDQTTFIIAQDISSNGQNKIEGVIQYIASLEKAGMPVDILSYQAIGKHLDIELHREQSNDTETNSGGPTGSATY